MNTDLKLKKSVNLLSQDQTGKNVCLRSINQLAQTTFLRKITSFANDLCIFIGTEEDSCSVPMTFAIGIDGSRLIKEVIKIRKRGDEP